MIYAVGLDWESATIEQRECFALDEDALDLFMRQVTALPSIKGCVLLQTCNRFEVYLDAETSSGVEDFLCVLPHLIAYPDKRPFPELFCFADEDAHRRIMEIASGLKSQIVGEDQIITQVRSAIERARKAKTTTSKLETLFRLAVTAGKAVRTQVRFQAVPSSSAHRAVEIASEVIGDIAGVDVLVIGNGTMGRLAAELLVKAGCRVTITLRSYHHGQTVVPSGCDTIPYLDRFEAIERSTVVMSATRSPHFTINESDMRELKVLPRVMIDMAVPRDIDPKCRDLEGMTFFDMDDLRDAHEVGSSYESEKAAALINKSLDDLRNWCKGRERYRSSNAQIALFAGTSEGRSLCQFLSEAGMAATVFVATEYGNSVLPDLPGIEVRTGRMDAEQMRAVLGSYTKIVDATHPYASEASRNISEAAKSVGAEYLRLVRPTTDIHHAVITVKDAQEAAVYLAETEGSILVTTGSKDLPIYTTIPGYDERVHPRILPDPQNLTACIELGYAPRNIICMQGPFTEEMNSALLKSTGAQWMVTKDSGDAGGISEKLAAAEKNGVRVVMITRPSEPVQGKTLDQIRALLIDQAALPSDDLPMRFPLFVSLVGKPCLVVGAGTVGMRRCRVLQEFGAKVTLIAPDASERKEGVEVLKRRYTTGDCEGMALVVAATNDRAVNHVIAEECGLGAIPVSVADCPEECTFFFPAIRRSRHLCAGLVSTGTDHRLVARTATALQKTMEEIDV